MDNLQKLFEAGQIGTCRIRNRVVMPPMTPGFSNVNGEPSEKLIAYYEARAKGGVGLIITECFRIDAKHGTLIPRQIDITNPLTIPKIMEMVSRVHVYGCKMFAQLQHGGSALLPMFNGGELYSCSAVKGKGATVDPIPLTIDQIKALEQDFVKAAVLCKEAGLDGVEIHAAHRYLIHQFMSSYFNKRDDEYGGSYENRARFCVNIIKGIKKACGRDFPVSVRISGNTHDNDFPGDISLEDAVVFAKLLEEAGADALNVSASFSTDVVSKDQGWRKDDAKTIRKAVNIPIIATNTIKEPSFAESLLDEGVCDFVATARAQLADPEWTRKAKEGRSNEIRRCISCLRCLEEVSSIRMSARCTVNPELGYESVFSKEKMLKNGNGRSIAVVGGGPAGMEAALVLAQRGFEVTLFEKNDHLGGSAHTTTKLADYKDKIAKMLIGLEGELVRAGVKICLNSEATPEIVSAIDPVAVFVAVGAKPIIPPITGINGSNVFLAVNVVDCIDRPAGKTVIIGSGQTGIESAEKMYQYEPDKDITIVEMLPNIGPGIFGYVLKDELDRLTPHGVKLIPGHKLIEVTKDGVKLQRVDDNSEMFVAADSVVLSLGVMPDKTILPAFDSHFGKVIPIGDANKGGRIGDAIWSAYFATYAFDPTL